MPRKGVAVGPEGRQLQKSLGLQTPSHHQVKDVPRDAHNNALCRRFAPHAHREFYIDRAHRKAREGDLKGALAVYTFAIRAHSSDWSTWAHRAALKLRMNDFQGARYDYDEAIRLNPLGASYEGRASCREALGDLEGAMCDLNEAIKCSPSAIKHCARARVRTSLGDLEGARADYDAGIQLDASYGVDFASRAAVRLLLGDARGAAEDCDAAIALEPRLAQAYANRASARHQLGSVVGSQHDFQTAVQLRPKLMGLVQPASRRQTLLPTTTAVQELKWHFKAVGDALSDYDRSVRLEPSHSTGHHRAARVQSRRSWSSSKGCALRLVNGAVRLSTTHEVSTYNDAFAMQPATLGEEELGTQAAGSGIRNFNDAFVLTRPAAPTAPARTRHGTIAVDWSFADEEEDRQPAALPVPLAPMRPLGCVPASVDGDAWVLLALPPSLLPLRDQPSPRGASVDVGGSARNCVRPTVNLDDVKAALASARVDWQPNGRMVAQARFEVQPGADTPFRWKFVADSQQSTLDAKSGCSITAADLENAEGAPDTPRSWEGMTEDYDAAGPQSALRTEENPAPRPRILKNSDGSSEDVAAAAPGSDGGEQLPAEDHGERFLAEDVIALPPPLRAMCVEAPATIPLDIQL